LTAAPSASALKKGVSGLGVMMAIVSAAAAKLGKAPDDHSHSRKQKPALQVHRTYLRMQANYFVMPEFYYHFIS
jgi:hypothetical protein